MLLPQHTSLTNSYDPLNHQARPQPDFSCATAVATTHNTTTPQEDKVMKFKLTAIGIATAAGLTLFGGVAAPAFAARTRRVTPQVAVTEEAPRPGCVFPYDRPFPWSQLGIVDDAARVIGMPKYEVCERLDNGRSLLEIANAARRQRARAQARHPGRPVGRPRAPRPQHRLHHGPGRALLRGAGRPHRRHHQPPQLAVSAPATEGASTRRPLLLSPCRLTRRYYLARLWNARLD